MTEAEVRVQGSESSAWVGYIYSASHLNCSYLCLFESINLPVWHKSNTVL